MDIYVGNLPGDITSNDLRGVFELFGQVETADVVRHGHGNESRGLGFVGMPARSEGICAVLGVHGRNVNGQMITATEVRPMDPVSGACHTRCHCRSGRSATGTARPISMAFTRERRVYGADENGLE
jgi:RNA recognition motif-containing protein